MSFVIVTTPRKQERKEKSLLKAIKYFFGLIQRITVNLTETNDGNNSTEQLKLSPKNPFNIAIAPVALCSFSLPCSSISLMHFSGS